MSEAELHSLKQRMSQGTWPKARRGALRCALPSGYVHTGAGEVVADADAQVQSVVRRLVRKGEARGTLHARWRYLVRHAIHRGVRLRDGPAQGPLEGRRPHRMTLHNLLQHPMSAGAYAYGRRHVAPRKQPAGRPSTGRVTRLRPRRPWLVKRASARLHYLGPG
jgi:hypothetical protein